MWGSGANTQTICANSATNFYITSNQPATSGVKAYGNVGYYIGKSLSSINTLSGALSESTPAGGAWDAAYDIWDSTNAYEIMIWENYTGTNPLAYNYSGSGAPVAAYTNVSVGGATYNVYEGNNGHDVISLVRTSKTNTTTTNILAVLQWIKSIGYFGNITVGNLQYGVEVTTSSGTQTWTINSYSLTSN